MKRILFCILLAIPLLGWTPTESVATTTGPPGPGPTYEDTGGPYWSYCYGLARDVINPNLGRESWNAHNESANFIGGNYSSIAEGMKLRSGVWGSVGWYGTLGGINSDYYQATYVDVLTYAKFRQSFQVVEPGYASISFGWDGTLSISPSEVSQEGDHTADILVSYRTTLSDDLSHSYEKSDSLSQHVSTETVSGEERGCNGEYTFSYIFSDDDVGKYFNIFGYLETYAKGSGTIPVSFSSDFFNTFEVTGYTGGISPVPIPGAVWLLGSGLIGLAAVRRRRKPHSPE